jgi:hypothetical protein
MQLAQDRADFSQAARCCKRASEVMEFLESKGQLRDPELISALTQTRLLLKAYELRPQVIEDLKFALLQDTPMAALLLVFYCDHYGNSDSFEQLYEASDALLELEPDDPMQFSIHMISLARAMSRCASRQEPGPIRDELIERAFVALTRQLELDPRFLIQNIDTQPDLAVLKNEPQLAELLKKYRQQVTEPQELR